MAFDVTVSQAIYTPGPGRSTKGGDTDNVGAAPGCVTVMMRVTWGDPMVVVTVMVAVRELADVFAVTFRVTFPAVP